MKSMLRVLILALVSAGLTAKEPSGITEKDLNQWLTFYYLKPRPELTVPAIFYMSEHGFLDKENVLVPFTYFLSRIFKKNASSVGPWMSRLKGLKQKHKEAIWTALWMSDTAQSRAILGKIAKDPKIKIGALAVVFTKKKPPNILAIEIMGPSDVDALWGGFLATGDERYVAKVISALGGPPDDPDYKRRLTFNSAKWSLTSNCAQHEKVMKIVEKHLAKDPPEITRVLAQVITDAQAKKRPALD